MALSNADPAFCAIYRWRLHPGTEDSFVPAWSRITELLLKERGYDPRGPTTAGPPPR
jgi:hypothetical protein